MGTKNKENFESSSLLNQYTYIISDIIKDCKRYIKEISGDIVTFTEITDQDIKSHLFGQVRLGAYPDDESLCAFAAIDVDLKKDLDFEQRYELAKKLQENLLSGFNIKSFLEISKSGNGSHIWVFFTGKLKRRLLQAILALVIKATTDYKIANGSIEIFPKGDKSGTGIFLPFFGALKSETEFSIEFLKHKRTAIIRDLNTIELDFPSEYFKAKEWNNG